jgi:hypothetical protein
VSEVEVISGRSFTSFRGHTLCSAVCRCGTFPCVINRIVFGRVFVGMTVVSLMLTGAGCSSDQQGRPSRTTVSPPTTSPAQVQPESGGEARTVPAPRPPKAAGTGAPHTPDAQPPAAAATPAAPKAFNRAVPDGG